VQRDLDLLNPRHIIGLSGDIELDWLIWIATARLCAQQLRTSWVWRKVRIRRSRAG
jgi:hypothetical protein